MSLRHPLARVKGLGASGEGAHHWWLQRLSALALVPLSLWFVVSIVHRVDHSYAQLIAWVAQPHTALLLMLYLGFMFFHAQLGVQVVIEDYVHSESRRLVSLLLLKTVILLVGAASIWSVVRIAV